VNEPTPIYDLHPWLAHYGPQTPQHLEPLPHVHLAELIRSAAQRYAQQPAFTTCMPNGMHGSLTYAQIDAYSDAFAAYLREVVGLAPGARVALQTPNCLAYPVVAFGVFKAGCVLVNMNPLYTAAEMTHQLADSGAEVLVVADLFADKLPQVLPATPLRRVVVCELTQFFARVPRAVIRAVMKIWQRVLPRITVEHTRLDWALAEGAVAQQRPGVDIGAYTRDDGPATLAALQYTGGTTGVSKGAMLTHGNLLTNCAQAWAMGRALIDEGRETVLTALPLYHIFAFQFNLLCFFAAGARNVLVPSPRPIGNLQRAFDNYRITWVSGVNTLFNALLNEEWFTAFPPKHLKVAVAGGAALQAAVAQRWRRLTDTRIAEGYGLTECAPVVCFNPIDGTQKPDSIGVPVPDTQVRLVDDAGHPVPAGTPGELIVRGPQVMQGYWGRPAETEAVLRDGWLYTGDVAVIDGDGYFRIVDRKKDMILVSGFNVYPNEVEEVIAQMEQVLEVAVIGVPDAKSGEAVRAYVVPRQAALTAEQVRAHCRQFLTDYKIPRSVEFRHDLPKTPVGKILRKDLKAEVAAR
jgi:long-chain acyl-CoA synthetase